MLIPLIQNISISIWKEREVSTFASALLKLAGNALPADGAGERVAARGCRDASSRMRCHFLHRNTSKTTLCCCSKMRVQSIVQTQQSALFTVPGDLTPRFLAKDVISRTVFFPCFPNTFQTSSSESIDSRVSRSCAEHKDTRPETGACGLIGSSAQEINNKRSRPLNIWWKVGACSTI